MKRDGEANMKRIVTRGWFGGKMFVLTHGFGVSVYRLAVQREDCHNCF